MPARGSGGRRGARGVVLLGAGVTVPTPDAAQALSAGRRTPGRPGALSEDLTALLAPQKSRKYRNTPTTVDGHRFDSKREAERYQELASAERAGKIWHLEVHPRFPLVVHGQDCGAYEADFAYISSDGERVVEDVKSAATRKLPTYRLKRRLVWALYGIVIQEV